MPKTTAFTLLIVALLAVGACGDTRLQPTAVGPTVDWQNLTPVANPNSEAPIQPKRLNPYAVDISPDGKWALVALRGSELEPGTQVALVDMVRGELTQRIEVGARPVAVRFHPSGKLAVVLSQMSPFAAVIDAARGSVVERLEVGHYAEDLVFSPDGSRMWLSDRARDEIQLWSLSAGAGSLGASLIATAPAGRNPDALALSPDGTKLYVADTGGLGLRIYDALTLVDEGFIDLNAPVFDVEAMGDWMIVATLNDTNGLPCSDDADYVGTQGDGIFGMVTDRTCSRGFADIQNEIAFIDPSDDSIAVRYTSDSAEVSEADREGDHPLELQRVVGALPQAIAVVSDSLAYVTMGASDELVELVLDEGRATHMAMPRSFATGFAPQGVAVDPEASFALVADELAETLSVIDLADGSRSTIAVGITEPAFPATSAEIGELFVHSAKFSTDGDQSCAHCHPDNHTDAKGWGVAIVRAFGRRATLPMRNLFATQPLLVEGVFDEGDFSLEMEGISLREDFHDSSYTLQVQRRNSFYREVSAELIGQEVTFDEMVKHVGNFLVIEPRLLPSPFDHDSHQVERGRALFSRPDVGCAACHPPPTFASAELFAGVTTLGTYDLPRRDLDPNISIKFLEQARDGFFNANSLRGLWDRSGALLHDGRARTVRETILTPGHACREDAERAFNEFDSQVDTNGGISHLTCEQIDDLTAYLMTID
jgi:DNA-binding beta-propeller fold protein YncE